MLNHNPVSGRDAVHRWLRSAKNSTAVKTHRCQQTNDGITKSLPPPLLCSKRCETILFELVTMRPDADEKPNDTYHTWTCGVDQGEVTISVTLLQWVHVADTAVDATRKVTLPTEDAHLPIFGGCSNGSARFQYNSKLSVRVHAHCTDYNMRLCLSTRSFMLLC